MTRLEAIRLKIAVNRATMSGDEFLRLLDDFAKAAVAEAIPHVVPMRTKDDALAAHEARLKNEDPSKPVVLTNAQVSSVIEEIKKDGPVPQDQSQHTNNMRSLLDNTPRVGGRPPLMNDEAKAEIRRRYKQAKMGRVRVEKGWVKHIAREYNVSEAYIYNVVYTDPEYKAI
jgi:hypothetical protein